MLRLQLLGSLSLRGADGQDLGADLTQPKRFALLAYLAAESPGSFLRRDTLLALFWPELSDTLARQSLRSAVYYLRQRLGDAVLRSRGADELGVDPDAISTDIAEFEQRVRSGEWEEALALYRGVFLSGFAVPGVAAEFDHWLDQRRAALHREAVSAARQLVDSAEASGNVAQASRWAWRWQELATDDEAALRRLMSLLDRQGDRSGAFRVYAEFASRIKIDFGVEPSAETRGVLAEIRRHRPTPAAMGGTAASVSGPDTSSSVAFPPAPPAIPPSTELTRSTRSKSHPTFKWLAGAGLLVSLGLGVAMLGRRGQVLPVIAVGAIRDQSGGDSGRIGEVLPELLTTDLTRLSGLPVVSHARIAEILAQIGSKTPSPRALEEAARLAGATEVVEGTLYHRSGDTLRLDIRRIELATGVVRRAYSVEGRDPFALADQVTGEMAREFALEAPRAPVITVTTTSLAARTLYEQGLRMYYRGDWEGASRLFAAALTEDSTYAMAAYYASRSEVFSGRVARERLNQAVRHGDRATERERLLIRWYAAYNGNDSLMLAVAESLAARYPTEPDGEYALGVSLAWVGRSAEARAHLERVVASDSERLTSGAMLCRACDALHGIVGSYMGEDSLAAAERVIRRWIRLQPNSASPWISLAYLLVESGHAAEEGEAFRHATELEPVVGTHVVHIANRLLLEGRFAEADEFLKERIRLGGVADRKAATDFLILSLRQQGRLVEALDLANRFWRNERESPGSSWHFDGAYTVGQVLIEAGHAAQSAALFDSMAGRPPPDVRGDPHLLARHLSWTLTHLATALAALGDTTRLARIRDSLTRVSQQSAWVRDRQLHWYVAGLLDEARGRNEDAIGELRQSIFHLSDGYTRSNYRLGAALLQGGQPGEAVRVLRAALHNDNQASSYYVTHTEVQELLARAFEASGQRDSAAAHYRVVVENWKRADPSFRARRQVAKRKARELGM